MDIEKKRSFIINFVYALIIGAISYVIIKYGLSLLLPFVVAAVIAWMLQRPVRFFHSKLGINKKLCSFIASLLFFATIGGLISLGGIEAITVVQSLVQSLPAFYRNTVEPLMHQIFDRMEEAALWKDFQFYALLEDLEAKLLDAAGSMVSKVSVTAVSAISGLAAAIPAIFIKVVLLIISTFFISMDYDKLVGFTLRQLNNKTRNIVMEIKNYIVGTLFVCIRSYALIMSITFVELTIGLTIVGIKNSVLVALCISLFDILPVLGTGGIMIPWVVINVILGNYGLAVKLLLVYIIITIVRNIIEPKIVGSQLGLHPVVTLSSMFAGVQILGGVGLFGFPICLSLLRHLNDKGIISIFK
ncbi:MAG: sporulation integral membrane protein YtvI [Firmicutes bacterium]|nr:sporulation integral membrane protein YtvI [Bacillota bacterium]